MNNEDSGNELFGISEQLREKKHDADCDCGICQYCNGTEDVYGNSTAPIKIANLERDNAALRVEVAGLREKLAEQSRYIDLVSRCDVIGGKTDQGTYWHISRLDDHWHLTVQTWKLTTQQTINDPLEALAIIDDTEATDE